MRTATVIALATSLSAACAPQGQKPDLTRFETPYPEFSPTKGPDGWYISRLDGPFGTDARSSIWRYPFEGGAPRKAVFGMIDADECELVWNAESQTACFVRTLDIWCVGWNNVSGWGEPDRLPSPVNTAGYESSPEFAPNGDLYFSSQREGGVGQGDIYRAVRSNERWTFELLGDAINSSDGEWNLALSPDGTAMVFESSGRATNRTNSGDLYLSCKVDGEWQPARPLEALNTDGSDLEFVFIGPRRGVFTSAVIGGDGVLRYAESENFVHCE